jgi:hypothetical protein
MIAMYIKTPFLSYRIRILCAMSLSFPRVMTQLYH